MDRNSKPLPKESRNLFMVASEESMRRKLELARGVMTLNQTEQWMFITKEPMRALSKATINFPKCSTAGQCLVPIDLPENGDVWQLTHGVKKKIFGEAMIRPAGPDPINPTSSHTTAGSAGEMPEKKRRTDNTVEPITFHATPQMAWQEISNIAGGNNRDPKCVSELCACDDELAFHCMKLTIPYLGVCFNDIHRDMFGSAWLSESL